MVEAPSELAAAIRTRYARVLASISEAAARSGRAAASVRLVVVTKSQPAAVVEAAIQAGARILGENYPEEAISKINVVREWTEEQPTSPGGSVIDEQGPGRVEWHMIGHIQGRKAKLIAGHFDLIHSLDSLKLARRIDQMAAEAGRRQDVLLEFNMGAESAKYGWQASQESDWPNLQDEAAAIAELPHIAIKGLMTMPPLAGQPEQSRPYFQKLVSLRDFLASRLPHAQWGELSMGTSTDFAIAVEEGATLVRVGEAIVGHRPTQESA